MGSKTPQIISHNHIKIKVIKIVGSKTQKKTLIVRSMQREKPINIPKPPNEGIGFI